jgi:hypothetical protein
VVDIQEKVCKAIVLLEERTNRRKSKMEDSNRKCGVIIFDERYENVLFVQEKYTNERLHEWVQWDDWRSDRLVKHMNTYTQKEVDMFEIEWKEEWEVGKITNEKVKKWLKEKREIPNSVLSGIGKWGIPKGHVRYGESFSEGMKREMKEEIGISISKMKYAFHQKQMQRNIYVTNIPKKSIFKKGYEIENIEWISVNKLTEMKNKEEFNCTVKLPLNYLSSNKSCRQ